MARLTLGYRRLCALIVFGIAFAFVEAAIVYYLRKLLGATETIPVAHYKTLFSLGFVSFIRPIGPLLVNHTVGVIEEIREAATLIMLAALAYLVGYTPKQRLGAFFVAFATWDIFYYVFLRILIHWPTSLTSHDVFFLIPVAWIGPVITPLIISAFFLVIGTRWYIDD
jgi:hypothetical protein